jgi:hypothetical protein
LWRNIQDNCRGFWDSSSQTKPHYRADGLIIGFPLKPKNRWNFGRHVGVYFSLPESCKNKKTREKMASKKPFVSHALNTNHDDSFAKLVHDM